MGEQGRREGNEHRKNCNILHHTLQHTAAHIQYTETQDMGTEDRLKRKQIWFCEGDFWSTRNEASLEKEKIKTKRRHCVYCSNACVNKCAS